MIEVGGRDGGQRWVEGKLENSGNTRGGEGIVDERRGKREW